MRKLLVLILILSMAMAVFCFTPTIMAENTIPDGVFDNLNNTIKDGVDYYINMKEPNIFASNGNLMAVVQGNDIIFKLGTKTTIVKDIVTTKDGYTLSSIGITRLPSPMGQYYNVYINYSGKEYSAYKTMAIPFFSSIDGLFAKNITTMSNHIALTGTVLTDEEKTDLDEHISKIFAVGNNLYAVIYGNGLYKITYDQNKKTSLTKLNLDKSAVTFVSGAKLLASNGSDIFIVKDDKIYKSKSQDGTISFPHFATYSNIKDIAVSNDLLFVLTVSEIKVIEKNLVDGQPHELSPTPISGAGKKIVYADGIVSVTIQGSDNITSYKLAGEGGNATLEFFRHYGANCVCPEPHEGWLNRPENMAVSEDNRLVYVSDKYANGDNRLNILSLEHGKYKHRFYKATDLGLGSIGKMAMDRQNSLYVADGNKLIVMNNKELYDSNPFSIKETITGFDGAITDIFISNRHESIVYALTDNNSVYKITEDKRVPSIVATFKDAVSNIAVSFYNDRLYVSYADKIESYLIGDVKLDAPLTTLSIANGIKDFTVDYSGTVFVATNENRIDVYKRDSATTYKKSDYVSNNGKWEDLNSMYIDPNNKMVFVIDRARHVVENSYISDNFYMRDTDTYVDTNEYNPELLFVGKTTENTRLYESPINYEVFRHVERGEYFYILAIDNTNEKMYKVVDNNNNIRYIEKDIIAKVEATKDSNIGTKFVPLFKSATIYKYPFEKSPVLSTTSKEMTFVDNVAYENDTYVWQNATTRWFKVEFVSTEGTALRGYVKMNEITKSTSRNAPSTKIHLRVTTKAGETVAMYDMPDIASGIVKKGIIDGTLVRLVGDKFDPASEFTEVVLDTEDGEIVGFIKTQYLQENKITTLQIVAIVVSCITALITILVIALVITYRKKKSNENTFKRE